MPTTAIKGFYCSMEQNGLVSKMHNENGCLCIGTETFTEHVEILFCTGYTVFYLRNAYPQLQKGFLQKRFAQKNNFMTVARRYKIMQGITVFLDSQI